MKIVHLITHATGGAAVAAWELHQGLLELAVDSHIITLSGGNISTAGHHLFGNAPIRFSERLKSFYRRKKWGKYWQRVSEQKKEATQAFSFARSAVDITQHPLLYQADIVHLHWVSHLLDYPSFFSKWKGTTVWTLHDFAPFTGGCHYPDGCQLFYENCQVCPQLHEPEKLFVAQHTHQLKKHALEQLSPERLAIVSPSLWVQEKSSRSSLFQRFRHFHIPHGRDSQTFYPYPKQAARDILQLPADKQVLLFVASDLQEKRKGFALLREALKKLELKKQVMLCVVGRKAPGDYPEIPVKILREVHDQRLMAMIYSACDATVIPSLEDVGPLTVLESLLCGTPVIAFPVGLILEAVVHQENGLIVEEFTVESLQSAIAYFLTNPQLFASPTIAEKTRAEYNSQLYARRYLEIYHHLSGEAGKKA